MSMLRERERERARLINIYLFVNLYIFITAFDEFSLHYRPGCCRCFAMVFQTFHITKSIISIFEGHFSCDVVPALETSALDQMGGRPAPAARQRHQAALGSQRALQQQQQQYNYTGNNNLILKWNLEKYLFPVAQSQKSLLVRFLFQLALLLLLLFLLHPPLLFRLLCHLLFHFRGQRTRDLCFIISRKNDISVSISILIN